MQGALCLKFDGVPAEAGSQCSPRRPTPCYYDQTTSAGVRIRVAANNPERSSYGKGHLSIAKPTNTKMPTAATRYQSTMPCLPYGPGGT
jgi:hypothetical protein